MKACRVEIVTQTEGKRTLFSAAGRTDAGLPRRVVYAGEDGETELFAGKDFLRVRREGLYGMEAEFRPGGGTLRLFAEGGAGEIPVETTVCKTVFYEESFFVYLTYRLLYAEGPQTFTLKIAGKVLSEEQ